MYLQIYQIFADFIYGAGVSLDNYQRLVCTELATLACLFVVALPFLVAWRVIKLFVG